MLSKIAALALVAALAEAAVPQGFNYGAQGNTGDSFKKAFQQAQNLPGTSGFNSARLYTMLQDGSTTEVTQALQAAIDTKTNLLLGMWVSGDGAFQNEMNALKSALTTYGDQMKNLVIGMSVGSEDLYRISPTGLSSPNPGPGVEPSDLVKYIGQVKDSLKGGPLDGVPVGHVDTWTAWANGSNSDVAAACDFLGTDAYPYWQSTQANGIENAKSLFQDAFGQTQAAANGKPVWITESGWPVQGKSSGSATAGTENAQKYWQQVGCPNFGKTPTFWYTVEEVPTGDNPNFSIFDVNSGKPFFDLSCSNVDNSTSTTSGNSTSTGTASISTGTGSGSGSGANNGTYTAGSPSSPSSTGSGSSGSGSGSSTGSGSGSKSSSGAAASGTGPATAGAAAMGSWSVGSLIAAAAGIAALL